MPRARSGGEVSSPPPRLLLHPAPERSGPRSGGRPGCHRPAPRRAPVACAARRPLPPATRTHGPAEGRAPPRAAPRPAGEPGARRADTTKRPAPPAALFAAGPEPSPLPQPRAAAAARPSPADLRSPQPPRHAAAAAAPYLGFPSLQLLQPLLVLHGVCAGEQSVTGGGRRGPPRPLPSAGAHTIAVPSRPASQRRQLPWRGHRRRHLHLHVNTRPGKVTLWPRAPPPAASRSSPRAPAAPSAPAPAPPGRLAAGPAAAAPGEAGLRPSGRAGSTHLRRGPSGSQRRARPQAPRRGRTEAAAGTPPSAPLLAPAGGRAGGFLSPQKNCSGKTPAICCCSDTKV